MKSSSFIIEIGRILLLSILSAILSMSFSLAIDAEICVGRNSNNAPGGGAAIGMLVLVVVGMPTIIWVSLSEIFLKLFQVHIVLRLASIVAPSIIAYIWMFLHSTAQCT